MMAGNVGELPGHCDHTRDKRPIRGQYPGHVITLDQSEDLPPHTQRQERIHHKCWPVNTEYGLHWNGFTGLLIRPIHDIDEAMDDRVFQSAHSLEGALLRTKIY